MASSFDLYVVILPADQVVNTQVFSFGVLPPTGVNGFYKTILKWVKCLLTVPGTDISDPTYGTTLAGLIGGSIYSARDIADITSLSVQRATDIIKSYQQGLDLDPNEALEQVALTSLSSTEDSVDAHVRVTNKSGTTLALSIPTGVKAPPQS